MSCVECAALTVMTLAVLTQEALASKCNASRKNSFSFQEVRQKNKLNVRQRRADYWSIKPCSGHCGLSGPHGPSPAALNWRSQGLQLILLHHWDAACPLPGLLHCLRLAQNNPRRAVATGTVKPIHGSTGSPPPGHQGTRMAAPHRMRALLIWGNAGPLTPKAKPGIVDGGDGREIRRGGPRASKGRAGDEISGQAAWELLCARSHGTGANTGKLLRWRRKMKKGEATPLPTAEL